MSGEDGELGERRGTGIKQPTKAQLDAAKKKRGEYVSDPSASGGEVGEASAPGAAASDE